MGHFEYYLIHDFHYNKILGTACIYLDHFLLYQLFLMHFNLWIESNWKKRGLDFVTGFAYTIESFGRQQQKRYNILFIALLSVVIDITSKPMIIHLSMSDNSAWRCCRADKYVDPANELCEWEQPKQ